MKYAFLNSSNIVVNCISGPLTPAQQEQFLRDYSALFGATQIIEVEDSTIVWGGGTYTDGQFQEPIVIRGTSEEMTPLEVPSDSLPS